MPVLSNSRSNRRLDGSPTAAEPEPWLTALPFAATLIDRDGVIRRTNERWTALPEAASTGQSYLQFCQRLVSSRTDAGAAVSAGIHSVLAGRQRQFQFEYPIDCEAGPRYFRITATPYHCGTFTGALLLCYEISAAGPPAGDEARRQSQRMETIGRLAGGVAHDFANLLTLISGYSDILLNRISHMDPLRAELDEIRKAAHRGSRLTSQLLGFSRGQPVSPRLLDANTVIAGMQRMLRPLIGEHIALETVLSPDLDRIMADPGQLEQIVMNLVVNARDAMPAGGTVAIETANRVLAPEEGPAHGVEPGPGVLLSVTDTGYGMDAGTMAHLYEPFFTTKEPGKGTGLGLSTVYGIVKQGHGDIWVRSAPGRGSTFHVWFPRAAAAQEPADSAHHLRAPAGSGTETILLVEDEDSVRQLLAQVLIRRGYTVIEAANGDDALGTFNRQASSIDLLLTDLVMPGMNGRELACRLLQVRPDLRVMFMSGYPGDVLSQTGALAHGMAFLPKPLRADTLAAAVRGTLDAPVCLGAAAR